MKTLLFELSKQYDSDEFYNYSPFVYYKRFYSDILSIIDDYGITGNYTFQSTIMVNIASLQVDTISFVKTDTLEDCQTQTGSFFWNYSEQKLYIHFSNNDRQLDKEILVGVILGFSNTYNETTENFYNSILYDERLVSVSNPKKAVDPLFFGKLKYNNGSAKFINTDGYFDKWRDGNYYGTDCRILYSDTGNDYNDFLEIGSGFVSDDSTTATDFTITIDDPRKGLEQPVATNNLTADEFASLPDDSADEVKPVTYGKVYYRKCILVNDTTHQYLFCDTEFNEPSSLDAIRNDTGTLAASTTSLSTGTFTLAAASASDVFASFTMPIVNGVEIIKDLMLNYDNKNYISAFWDITEVDAAKALCTNTSYYDNEGDKLSDAIESICFDCDLRMFIKDNGVYTIRKYDVDRVPVTSILWDDWIDDFSVKNTASEYLTDCTVQYQRDDFKDGYRKRYKNSDYRTIAYDRYKKYKAKNFESGLYELTAATAKSETIMQFSSDISDIIERTVNWNFIDLELCDFVYASPKTRVHNAENETLSIYEIIGITKDLDKKQIKLTLKYIKES